MRLSLKSIYFQLLFSFLFIIMATLTISTIFEYYTYTSHLPRVITEIRTKSIAQHLSSAYTRDDSLESLVIEIQRLINLENLNTIDDASQRIVIRDNEGKTVYNSFSKITRIETLELIEGESQPILDFKTSETIGIVTIYISKAYVQAHAQVYVSVILKSGIYKALITAVIAFLLSIILSRYITKPVIQLTNAAQSIAEERDGSRITVTSSNELGRLGNAFNSMLSSLQSQKELRKQLLSNVSHEINTPLNAIRLEARGLSDGLVSSDEASFHIINEIDALKNVIYDLDWMAETDSGALSLKKEKYPISNLITEEVKRWVHKAETRNIKIVTEGCSHNLPEVEIDVIRISTVMGNLIDNAIKYSPENSLIRVDCVLEQNNLIISVCDNGPSIPAEHRQDIFNRFYRVKGKDIKTSSGRGLGLSIVKQIIEMHHGEVRLECNEPTGNCFFFTLPVITA